MWLLAIILLVGAWVISWFLISPGTVKAFWYLGWAIWLLGAFLIVFSFLRIYGRVKLKSDEVTANTIPVFDRGVYSLVRQPLYLGWMLMYVVVILFGQHWISLVLGIAGIVLVYLIIVQEDQRLMRTIGEDYVRYAERVPRTNIVLGVIRTLRRKKTEQGPY